MSGEDLDKSIQEFKRNQKKRRFSFIVILIGTLAVVMAVLWNLSYRAKQARTVAEQESNRAEVAVSRLDAVASDLLEKVQATDVEAQGLAHGENPTLYLWRAGLHPPKAERHLVRQTDPKLIHILIDRRSLLSSAGPALDHPNKLRDYVCGHIWHVVGESALQKEATDKLRSYAEKDQRFELAQVGTKSRKLGWLPIIVGFFLTRQEAEDLAKEVSVGDFQIRVWNFEEYQPDCPGIKE